MTCIIIEDEIPAQNILKNYIHKIPNLELKAVFNTALGGYEFLKNEAVDIVFLDINLPDISGLDVIKTIKNPPALIITTAYPDYAVSSFELDTIVDYLVKPYAFNRFLKAVSKAETRIKNTKQNVENPPSETLFLNVDKTLHKIVINDILYLESDRNYLTIVTKTQKLTCIDALKNWANKLPETYFIQIHKSFIINTAYVSKLAGNEVFIETHKLPIGRSYKATLLERLEIG